MGKTSGFVAGTKIQTEQGRITIQDVKIGDMVLSKPENGEGEASYKSVLNTFIIKNKELWLIKVKKHWSSNDFRGQRIDRNIFRYTLDRGEFIATSNQIFFVVGMGIWDGQQSLESITLYEQPLWKQIDQLKQFEVVVNKDNVLFYVEYAQPLYQFKDKNLDFIDPTIAWYQQNYYVSKDPMDTEDIEFYEFDEGIAIDVEVFNDTQHLVSSELSNKIGAGSNKINTLKDEDGHYIAFNDTVYNFEIEDHYTYFVTMSGIWVHQ